MSADIRTLLACAADGPPAVPPPGLADRARRRLRRRRVTAVCASAAAALTIAVPAALLALPGERPQPSGIADAVRDDELTRRVSLDGGRLLLDPYRGDAAFGREAAEAEFRSAERIFWARTTATDIEVRLALAAVTVDEPSASLRDEPAWVALYRYRPVAFGCPMRSGEASLQAPSVDTRWHAFVLPLDGSPAFLWHGQATGACGLLPGPQVEAARKHVSAPWRETGRTGTSALIDVEIPCEGTVDELHGPDPHTGELRVVVSSPTATTSLQCPAQAVRKQVDLPRPGFTLAPAPVGILGGATVAGEE